MCMNFGKTSEKIKEMKGGMKDDERPDRRDRIKLSIDRCWQATTGQADAAAAMWCSILILNQEGTNLQLRAEGKAKFDHLHWCE